MSPQAPTAPKRPENGHGGPRPGAGRPAKNGAANGGRNAQLRRANEKRADESAVRERLLKAAAELLNDDGYESLTVTAVCREADLSAQTFYEHFADKRALLAALHGPDVEEIDRRLRAAVAEQSALVPALSAALDQALTELHPSPQSPRARLIAAMIELATERGFEATSVPELAARAEVSRGAFYRNFDDLRACLAAAQATSLERIELHLEEAAARAHGAERLRIGLEALCDLLAAEPAVARILLIEAGALTGADERRLADVLCVEAERAFPDAPAAARRFAADAATSLLRAELAASGVHGFSDLASDLTFAALGPLVGPEAAHDATTTKEGSG